MTDRQQEVLNAIDLALDGSDEDWTVSGDAMRWSPKEGTETDANGEDASSEPSEGGYGGWHELRAAVLQRLAGSVAVPVYDHPPRFAVGGFIEGPPERVTIDLTRERIITPAEVRTWVARANPGAVRGPNSSDAILVRLSPAEAIIPGPNGPIHIRDAYGDQPMQVTEVDLDDMG